MSSRAGKRLDEMEIWVGSTLMPTMVDDWKKPGQQISVGNHIVRDWFGLTDLTEPATRVRSKAPEADRVVDELVRRCARHHT